MMLCCNRVPPAAAAATLPRRSKGKTARRVSFRGQQHRRRGGVVRSYGTNALKNEPIHYANTVDKKEPPRTACMSLLFYSTHAALN